MPLTPGTRLGPHEIVGLLGAGGMGEVYRARDTRLARDVAIKTLPATDADDAERRTRFEREAQAIAALNHPNIVTIHSVENSGGVHFLTMELVEGKTLRELLPRAGLPIDRLLEIAVPLADAIGTAHSHGIIHRDLKPANVMVTADGRVKVLDFGLAKLKAPESALSNLTTVQSPEITADGSVLGTVAYMSPEQAEGREVDQRTDVFSLGVLLFELATGQRPFKGESNVSLLSSILRDVPPTITELKPELPQELGRFIRRCLSKDPGRRYQSALDLRNDLDDLRRDLEFGERSARTAEPVGESRPKRFSRASLATAVVGLASTVAVAYVLWPTPAEPTAAPRLRTTLQPPVGVQMAPQSAPILLAISPDGQSIAYLGTSDDPKRRGLYLRSVTELESRLVRDEAASSPFFSPDSKWLGYWANNAIWKVPVGGGQPMRICTVADELRGASWGDDGAIVFAASIADKIRMLWRVPASGGEPVVITNRGPLGYFFPHVLPGSRAALVMLIQEGERTVAVVSLQTGAIVRKLFQGSTPQYTANGFLVFRWLETLYAAPFDLEQLNVTGESKAVLNGVSYNLGGSQTSALAISRTGSIVYMPAVRQAEDAELIWIDRRGQIGRLAEARKNYFMPSLDPEGRRVAVHIEEAGDRYLAIYTIGAGTWARRTTGLRTSGQIVWSPDGRWVVFSVLDPSGIPSLFRVRAEGGEPERLTHSVAPLDPAARVYDFPNSIHGDLLMFDRQVGSAQFDLMTLRLEPLGQPAVFLKTKFETRNGQISPDGRWVAYESTEAGGRQIVVRSFSSPNDSSWSVASDARQPQWSRDGRTLFYFHNQEIWAAPVVSNMSSGEFRVGPPKLVVRYDPLEISAGGLSTDVDRFLIVNRPRTERLLVYVANFGDEVKEIVRRSR